MTNRPMIENWHVTKEKKIFGYVFNHPTLANGKPMVTSTIQHVEIENGVTFAYTANSKYELGEANAQYAAQFENCHDDVAKLFSKEMV